MLKSVLLLAAAAGAAAQCICPTPVLGDPLCAYQYVLVGKALTYSVPNCAAPTNPQANEVVNINKFKKSVVTFEVEAVIKQPLVDDSPLLAAGEVVQVWSSVAEGACGYQMEPESSYIITAYKENLEGCLKGKDPEKQTLDLATTSCSDNIANPTVFELLAFAEDCGADLGVEETPEEELVEVEAVAATRDEVDVNNLPAVNLAAVETPNDPTNDPEAI